MPVSHSSRRIGWPLWFFIEIIVIAVLVPSSWTEDIIRSENHWVRERMGSESAVWIETTAARWYNRVVVETGFLSAAYRHLLPSEDEKKKSRGLEHLGEKVYFPYIEARLKVLFFTVYQLFARLMLLIAWLPFLLIVAVPAVMDGMLSRRIRRLTFAYNSPLVHGYAATAVVYAAVLLFLSLCAPLPLPPEFFPIVLSTMALAAAFMSAHAPKRI